MRTVVLWVSRATLFLAPKQNQSLSIKTTIIMVRIRGPRLAIICSSRNFCWAADVYIFRRSLSGKEIQFSLLVCLSFLSIHAMHMQSRVIYTIYTGRLSAAGCLNIERLDLDVGHVFVLHESLQEGKPQQCGQVASLSLCRCYKATEPSTFRSDLWWLSISQAVLASVLPKHVGLFFWDNLRV